MSLTTFETREILLPVESYVVTKEMAADGDHNKSEKFNVGGYDWTVRCYPNNGESHISVTLVLLTVPKEGGLQVGARFTCALQDRHGHLSTEFQASSSNLFSQNGEEDGFWAFVTHSALEGPDFFFGRKEGPDYLVEDSFTLMCTVSVLKKPQPRRV